eukprot:CAMPEP_0194782916 /NCGR_PEP_ID=MMETSP0323_2-20130528/78942_1 /TAXON_ID=2866 ORGANISM="Crypthecodinium cohnii, Strain Seligo" /NCGR_SAMPLE_ID=MMETSP0323_2 /ASSEMBLY_ACC=CAM_ASM_000346 /LENGTH=120 /DNA_ID=CAMNT_0039721757 /DNA_START=390 /DNA_END=753 /DNA_ORIENTATION=-
MTRGFRARADIARATVARSARISRSNRWLERKPRVMAPEARPQAACLARNNGCAARQPHVAVLPRLWRGMRQSRAVRDQRSRVSIQSALTIDTSAPQARIARDDARSNSGARANMCVARA